MPRQPATEPAPLEGALVRLPLADGRWAEDLPPVPRGFDVTVSFSSDEAAAVHAEALELLGYRVVGVRACRPDERASADVLVSQALLEARPRWWRALRARADRAYGLAFGPALASLADVLSLHAPKRTGW